MCERVTEEVKGLIGSQGEYSTSYLTSFLLILWVMFCFKVKFVPFCH